MKTKRKEILITISILLAVLLICTVSFTVAYLSSKRNVTGYLNFANGVELDYGNVVARTSSETGNLLHFVDSNNNNAIDENELVAVNINNINPGQTIQFANPYLQIKENSVSLAFRLKFKITEGSNVYETPEEINNLLSNGAVPVFENGNLKVQSDWKFNSIDKYYYFASSDDIQNSLIEVSHSTYPNKIFVFDADAENENLITCDVVDGEPIESLPVKNLKLELYIEAIQFSSINVWLS